VVVWSFINTMCFFYLGFPIAALVQSVRAKKTESPDEYSKLKKKVILYNILTYIGFGIFLAVVIPYGMSYTQIPEAESGNISISAVAEDDGQNNSSEPMESNQSLMEYEEGLSLLDNAQYAEAKIIFEALDGFLDSNDLAILAHCEHLRILVERSVYEHSYSDLVEYIGFTFAWPLDFSELRLYVLEHLDMVPDVLATHGLVAEIRNILAFQQAAELFSAYIHNDEEFDGESIREIAEAFVSLGDYSIAPLLYALTVALADRDYAGFLHVYFANKGEIDPVLDSTIIPAYMFISEVFKTQNLTIEEMMSLLPEFKLYLPDATYGGDARLYSRIDISSHLLRTYVDADIFEICGEEPQCKLLVLIHVERPNREQYYISYELMAAELPEHLWPKSLDEVGYILCINDGYEHYRWYSNGTTQGIMLRVDFTLYRVPGAGDIMNRAHELGGIPSQTIQYTDSAPAYRDGGYPSHLEDIIKRELLFAVNLLEDKNTR